MPKINFNSEEYAEKVRSKLLQYSVIDNSGCWIWQHCVVVPNPKTPSCVYGRVSFMGKTDYAHRVSYIVFRGDLTPGMVLDHLCRNTLCCNPHHLEEVTQLENIQRAPTHIIRGDGRPQKFQWGDKCKHGHIRTPETTYVTMKSGRNGKLYEQRYCKICNGISAKAARDRKMW